jgi:hypothetical protein
VRHVRKEIEVKFDLRVIGGDAVLAGAISGKRVLGQLLASMTLEPTEPEPVFLDFGGVEVATASFLRESALAFRNAVRGRRSNFYPVIANANAIVQDELRELVSPPRNDVLIACKLDANGTVSNVTLIGELEPAQRRTFDLVRERGETDASELMHEFGKKEQITRTTAWNNRLTSLAFIGLLVELSQGRAKRYRPLFEGV